MKALHPVLEVFLVSLKLGLGSFGGPLAHLGYFHKEYVDKRKWLDNQYYLELVALCQILPGPSSSQLGISIGTTRAGIAGGIAAWLGFTLPSAIFMTLFALTLSTWNLASNPGIHGLKIVAVAVVFQAILTMWKTLVTTRMLATLAVISAALVLLWDGGPSQILVIAGAAVFGAFFGKTREPDTGIEVPGRFSRLAGIICLVVFVLILILLPVLRSVNDDPLVALADALYRSGSLVFGGGHVVLPLLQNELADIGPVSGETFLAGYGAAQAMPGPLFTFAAFLGGSAAGVPGALTGLISIFLPGYLLVIGVLPFWSQLRRQGRILRSLASINAAVVGILLAALYNPLWTTSIQRPVDFCFAAVLVLLLAVWKLPPLLVVLTGFLGILVLGLAGLF